MDESTLFSVPSSLTRHGFIFCCFSIVTLGFPPPLWCLSSFSGFLSYFGLIFPQLFPQSRDFWRGLLLKLKLEEQCQNVFLRVEFLMLPSSYLRHFPSVETVAYQKNNLLYCPSKMSVLKENTTAILSSGSFLSWCFASISTMHFVKHIGVDWRFLIEPAPFIWVSFKILFFKKKKGQKSVGKKTVFLSF